MLLQALTLPSILRSFRVPRDGALVVHSAIATLSRQGMRAEELIETLLDYMADGDVLMPTMTWRTVTPAQPRWDEMETPSHTGVLSEIFRTRYSEARSIHPTHSVAGRGPNAAMLLSRHHLDIKPVSANSPYGLLRDYETYILLLGVGLESCTAIHLPEETINPHLYLLPPETVELYHCRDRHGTVHEVRTLRHRRLDRDFPRFGPPLEARKLLGRGALGDCPYMLVSMRALLREVFGALLANPSATLRGTTASYPGHGISQDGGDGGGGGGGGGGAPNPGSPWVD
jgi:aminoglycoside 3-N-acetyltransferase